MTNLQKRLSEILHNLVNQNGAVGVAVAVTTEAKPEAVWLPASDQDEPIFLAYSITKTFTAVLLLLLHQEGRLSLEDPLARWFPHIAQASRISLRQLLNHTAGIPDYGSLQAYHDAVRSSPSRPWSFAQFAETTFDQGLCFAPGTSWAYSNPGYMLLKHIAEAVTDTSYAHLIADRVVQPLGLRQTFVPQSIEELDKLAPAISQALSPERTPQDVRHTYHPGWVSHGVVASTPSEIVLFFNHLFGDRFFPQRYLEEMTDLVAVSLPATAHPSASDSPKRWVQPGYGLGLMGDSASAWGRVFGHNGGGPGYSASAFYAPQLGGVSVCAMAAIEGFQAEEVTFAVLDLFA